MHKNTTEGRVAKYIDEVIFNAVSKDKNLVDWNRATVSRLFLELKMKIHIKHALHSFTSRLDEEKEFLTLIYSIIYKIVLNRCY